MNIDPPKLPVLVNGMFGERTANSVHDPLHARALVLDDGKTKLAIVVVDIACMPRSLIDEAKQMAEKVTGIPADRMLVSATHTHSAPSAMSGLGSRNDPDYTPFLTRQIARSIQLAQKNLEPAEVGWGVVADFEHTKCRNWIKRTDKIDKDPFGRPICRAMMHPRPHEC